MSSLDIPGGSLPIWGAYLRLLARAPVRSKCITSAVIFAISQLTAKYLSDGTLKNLNLKKLRDFILWGLCMPIAAHHWQNFMAFHGPQRMWIKIPFDHVAYRIPIMFVFSNYIKLMEGCSFKESWDYALKTNPSLQITSLKLWPAANMLNFAVVPLPLRVLWQNIVLYFWTLYLAFRLRADQKKVEDAASATEKQKQTVPQPETDSAAEKSEKGRVRTVPRNRGRTRSSEARERHC